MRDVGGEAGVDVEEAEEVGERGEGVGFEVLMKADPDVGAEQGLVAADLFGVEAEFEEGVMLAQLGGAVGEAFVDVLAEGAEDGAVGAAVEVLGEGSVGGVAEEDDDFGVGQGLGDVGGGGGGPEVADAGFADGGFAGRVFEEAEVGGPGVDDAAEAFVVHGAGEEGSGA